MGGSVGATLPKEMAERLHMEAGDRVLAVETDRGNRDEDALESALSRPLERWHYDPETDLPRLAAAYAFGISRNHPFRDGNERTAFLAAAVFLRLNGLEFDAPEDEVVGAMRTLAAGETTEEELAAWLRGRSRS